MQFKQLFLSAGLGLAVSHAQAPLDVRVALVIGNAAYAHATPLDNAAHDARAIAKALRALGFSVVEVQDASRLQMSAALDHVKTVLKGQQALGMLYYAGHGLQMDWHNYMLPVDARIHRAADVAGQSMDVDAVVNVFKGAGTRMNILVLDACRNNPFVKTTATTKGLAPMDAPPGTLLAYATQPGNVAEDGDSTSLNGPYAQFLQLELHRPFARVEDVFKRVRLQVRQKTAGRQIPWESTSLEEDFMFNDGTRHTVSADELERLSVEAKRREQELQVRASTAREREKQIAQALEKERQAQDAEARARQEQLLQAQARELARMQALQAAIALESAQEARRAAQALALAGERLVRDELGRLTKVQRNEKLFSAEKADWDRIRDSKTAADVYAYLDKHPGGAIAELAQAKLEKLDKAKTEAIPDRTGQLQPLEARRFRQGDSYQFVVHDLLTKLELERPTFTVLKADDELVEFNQGYKLTQAGAIIRTIGGATLDPYQQWIPAGEYQVGKKWHTRSIMTLPNGRQIWVEMHGRILARETITVPAGAFDAYKMVMEQTAQDGTHLKVTYWGQPDWGVAIKQIREVREANGKLGGQVYELISRKAGA